MECQSASIKVLKRLMAFDLFLRWAPRAQPVLEDTTPAVEVTRQIGPPENTPTVPVPMNLISLLPPGRP